MKTTLGVLPFTILLIGLPFPITVPLRLTCLAAAFLIVVVSWRRLDPPPFPCKWAIALWAGVVIASLHCAVDPVYSLGETRSEVGHGLMAFVAFLARIVQCAVKSHGSPVGETKQTHPGTNRSARNRLEG